ncbi:MAG: cobyrinate a,c-diamide synthase [Roseitalea porphyridii]|jgi:cobyrinic acid a,c-diamide synthase|uniref:cobyrinate a,c-diamide synthase n=1 Tax=Roseitalea porphyridii TaxID=1852022 RepID=UPI0032F03ADF
MTGFLVAAPHSGSGKTVVTLGLLRALRDAGHAIAPAKAGPDYIDPAFHRAASGETCVNLDPWAMRPALLRALVAGHGAGRLLVTEAMMGLYDGAADGTGSAADLAALLGLPVVFVVDASRMAQSVAALVSGYRDHRADVALAGIILNRVGSARHETMLRDALAPLGVPVLGVVPHDAALSLPSRHLGLVQAGEHEALEAFIAHAGAVMARCCDLPALAALAQHHPDPSRLATLAPQDEGDVGRASKGQPKGSGVAQGKGSGVADIPHPEVRGQHHPDPSRLATLAPQDEGDVGRASKGQPKGSGVARGEGDGVADIPHPEVRGQHHPDPSRLAALAPQDEGDVGRASKDEGNLHLAESHGDTGLAPQGEGYRRDAEEEHPVSPIPPLGQRIAVARDIAFAFAYPHLLDGWRAQGAELTFFSPLGDEAPDASADAVFLPGGYPELHAGALAAADGFRAGMVAARDRGAAIYGECGGYMALGEGLVDADGARHAMLGFLPVETSFATRTRHLGYRRLDPLAGAPWPMPLTAHEFHYATVLREGPGDALFAARDARGADLGHYGRRVGTVSGSWCHVIDRAD